MFLAGGKCPRAGAVRCLWAERGGGGMPKVEEWGDGSGGVANG